ncbi:MAG: His/Gly/Thr/Pro-type tRNA ligase C-terminal domain-containing protein, partial [Candidatus Margulisbacteria bacterium]|nr:His/Gly/Thr/Pro-type tRNA ligase C-terminal domain-containing protein [Candidatus Margulisiibacteriota bacterium]
IADRHNEYAKTLAEELNKSGIRVEINDSREKIGAKIRDAQMQKIPYMVILGDKEMQNQSLALRHRSAGDMGERKLAEFVALLRKEIDNKA